MTARWIPIWSRGMRSEPGRSLGVAALVLVTVVIAASVPRLLVRASDDALRADAAAAASTVRNLQLVQSGRIAAGSTDPLGPARTAGTTLEARYPAPLPSVVAGRGMVIDTPLWHVSAGTNVDTVLNLRMQQDVDAHVRLTAGRWPTGATTTIHDPGSAADVDSDLVVFEVATSSQTAGKLGLAVGARLILAPEPSDPLAANRAVNLAVDLVGTYDVIAPTEPYWMDDASVDHSYIYALSALVEYAGATMLLAPGAYPALMTATLASGMPMTYHWRSYVGAATLESDQLDDLSAALRRATTIYPPANPNLGNGGLFAGADQMSPASLRTGLPGLIAAHQARWLSGATILTIMWTGASLVILASLALVAETIARRRRVSLAVVGRRGASPGQIAAAILSESSVLVLPATIVGSVTAGLLIPVPNQGPTVVVATGIAIGAIAFIIVASRRNRAIDSVERPRRLRRPGSGRLVAEVFVVGLAVVGAILLRGRSPGGTAAGPPPPAGPDPFLAVAPALVGLAAGIIAVRLLPLVAGFVARLLAERRGLVAVLGLRRAARDGSVAAVLVVALTATTVASFASALLDQVDAGARSAAWQTVGADYQLTGSPDGLAAFQASPPTGVDATAAISAVSVAVSTGGGRTLLALDPAALTQVARGTPAEPDFPASILDPVGTGPLPAIISSDAGGSGPIALGQGFSVRIGGTAVPLRAVAVRSSFPSVPAGEPFIVVSSRDLTYVPVQTAVLVRSSALTLAQLQAATANLLGVTVQGRAVTQSSLRDAPAVTAVALGILSAAAAVLAYGLLTITLAIALDTASRRRETARLQILGLSNRQVVALVMIEFAPVVVVGVLAGLGLGLALIAFVGPGLGLPAVLGVARLEPVAIDAGRLLAIAGLTLALILAATLLSTVLERQTQLATAVRD